jgi:hypothetical protein
MITKDKDMVSKEKEVKATGAAVVDSVKEAASKTGEVVKDAASTVAHKVSDAGSYVAHKAEDATSAVGCEMKSLAGTIREKGPHDGMLGNASSAVANTLESAGRELQEHGLSGIADDITNTVRRHPVPSVLIGIGLGFMLARLFAK